MYMYIKQKQSEPGIPPAEEHPDRRKGAGLLRQILNILPVVLVK